MRLVPRLALLFALLAAADLSADEPYGRHQFDDSSRSHWSFKKLERPLVPAMVGDWGRNPIDAFVAAGLAKAGLTPATPADRITLLRRVYLDLIGLPPTPEEVAAYLADTSDSAFERVVDDLLSRPQYGERWARHWLDVVRYAETNGYERDGAKPEAWKYRDWVIQALNRDLPYDEFIIQQLAGDEIADSDAESQIATTMLRLGAWDDEPADPLTDRYDQLDDIVGATSAAFLGMTLRCARCHDHKFEPLTAKDYARWTAVFAPLTRPQTARTEHTRDVGPHEEVAAHHAKTKQLDQQQAGLTAQLQDLSWQVIQQAATDGRLPVTQLAAQQALGDQPAPATGVAVSDELAQLARQMPGAALIAANTEPAKRSDEQKKLVAEHFEKVLALTKFVAPGEQRSSIESLRGQLAAVQAEYPTPLPQAYIWYEKGPTTEVSHVFDRGDPRSPRDEVAAGVPAILVDEPLPVAQPTSHSTGRRLQLARWLTSSNNPLVARVMVNRLWQHHFGDGLVASENDFGVMGEAPANQPLLDWLASELVAGGWRMKRIHRMMVLSETYRMSSAANEQALRADPTGALMWRFRPRRLEAEALRDAILAVSGQLNLKASGPSVFPKISRAVLETQSVPGNGWNTSEPAEAQRRSVYIFVKRTLIVPELDVLDFPATEESCAQRIVSTVAPQALTLLNGEFMHEQAAAMAARLTTEVGRDDNARVDRAYLLALGRSPSQQERAAVLEFLDRQRGQIAADSAEDETVKAIDFKALTAMCLVILNTNEFAYLQ
jgi:hypothetical protein